MWQNNFLSLLTFDIFYFNLTDNVLKIIELVRNAHIYSEPTSVINNVPLLSEIVKKCGFKSNLVSNPNKSKKSSDDHLKDAFKR